MWVVGDSVERVRGQGRRPSVGEEGGWHAKPGHSLVRY